MNLAIVGSQQESATFARALLGLGNSCPAFESRFEILRATVWSMAAPSGKVHTNRLLTAAIPSWKLLCDRTDTSDEALRAELRESLSVMQDAGDLIGQSGGFWGPATVRLVKHTAENGYLLVGGVPSMLLPMEQDCVQYHGPYRSFTKCPSGLATWLPLENLASWARLPAQPLEEWARGTIDSLELHSYAPLSADTFEFYLPEHSRKGTPQFKRWFNSAGAATGVMLARRTRIYGAREYRLLQVQSGKISAARELQGIDVRRLMYAFDQAAKNPVRARFQRGGNQSECLLTSELPRAEQRTFATLGRLTIPAERPFERRWAFLRYEEVALERLRCLGISVE